MSGRLVSFPVPYGKGLQRVSLYAPTTALPYYRITYRTGGKRFQRKYICLEKADREARAIADKLALGEVSVAQLKAAHLLGEGGGLNCFSGLCQLDSDLK